MNPMPPDQWDPSLRHIIDDMHGRPLQIHCLLANHPALLNAWWNYRMYSVKGGDLEQRDCELVILRVAVHMKAWYEWAAHVVRGLEAGLSLAEIYRVAAGPSAAEWGEKDAVLLSAVDQLVVHRSIPPATRTRLEDLFSEKQLIDLVSLQGMYLTIACMIGTWPVEIEEHIAKHLPEEVSEESFRKLLSATNGN